MLASDYANENEDLTIIACGPMVPEAMRAAYILKKEFGFETRIDQHAHDETDSTPKRLFVRRKKPAWSLLLRNIRSARWRGE